MPYIPQKDGKTIWVEEEDAAQQQFRDSWGSELPEQTFGGISQAPNEPEKDKAGIFEPVRVVTHGLTAIPGDLYGLGQKMGTWLKQEGRIGEAIGTMGMDDEEKESYRSNARYEMEALQNLGVQGDGSAFGLPKSFGLWSTDSQFRKDWLKPRTGLGRLGSDIVSVIGSAKITAAAKIPGVVAKSNIAFKLANSMKLPGGSAGIKGALRGAVIFTVKDLIPNALEDIAYFQPDANPEVSGALKEIANLPIEQRHLAVKALLAETDSEYNYYMETIEEVAGGAVAVIGLRSIFKIGRKILKSKTDELAKGGKPEDINQRINQQLESALDEELPNVVDDIDAVKATESVQYGDLQLSKLQKDFRDVTDNLSRDTSMGAHAVGENFLNKSLGSPVLDDSLRLQELADDIDGFTPLTNIEGELARIEKAAKTSDPKEIKSQLNILRKTLAGYESKIEANPIQYTTGPRGGKKKVPGTGWESQRSQKLGGKQGVYNSTLVKQVRQAIEELEKWENLQERKTKYEGGRTTKQAERDRISKELLDYYGEGEEGFRKFINSIRQGFNETDNIYRNLLEKRGNQNSLLEQMGRNDEVIEQPIDEFTRKHQALRELLEEAEGKSNFDTDFIEQFVKRADDIHEGIIKAGGVAPTKGEAVETLRQLDLPTDTDLEKLGKDLDPKVVAANQAQMEEGNSLLAELYLEGSEESKQLLAEKGAEEFKVPVEKFREIIDDTETLDEFFEIFGIKSPEVGGGKADPGDIIPPRTTEIVNQTPLKTTPNGGVQVNTDQVNLRRASKAVPAEEMNIPIVESVARLNEENFIYQPVKTEKSIRALAKRYADAAQEMQRYAEEGKNIKEFTPWFRSNVLTYVPDADIAAVVEETVKILGKRGFKIERHSLMASTQMLIDAANNPEYVNDLIGEAAEYAKGVKAGLPFITVATSMLRNNALQALKASKELQDIRRTGALKGGYSDRQALVNFKNSFTRVMNNVHAVSDLFEGFGNGLRLMRKQNRLQFEEGRPGVVIESFGRIAERWGDAADFGEELAKATQKGKETVTERFNEFISKVDSDDPLTEADWEGIDNLVGRVFDSQGDLTKLKELEVTGPSLLRRVQSAALISSPMTFSSIPPQAAMEGMLRHAGITGSSYANAAVERFIKRNTGDEYVEALRLARQNHRMWLEYKYGLQEAWEDTKARWFYGRSISDPGVFNRAAEISKAGVLRESKISDELKATQIKIPFTDLILKKEDFEKEAIFNALNEIRVGLKVFHDYAIAGEAWEKRSWQAKWLLAPAVTGARKIPGLKNLGTKSYYPNGEMVNMTAPFQFAALGDEFMTSFISNAAVKANIEVKVDEMIASGALNVADRAEEVKKLLDKGNRDFYEPVRAGMDDEIIGHTVINKQLENVMQFTREVNRTEELTGPFAAAGKWINWGRYHEGEGYSPYLNMFANTMAGVVTSPLNSIKWGLRWGLGTDIPQSLHDATRIGIRSLGEHLPDELQKRVTQNNLWKRHLTEFESKYFSKDLNTRVKAQGALATAVGMHTMAWMQMMDPELEVTGGLENTYRSEQGQVGLYTMKISTPWGGFRFPYRWIPIYGNVMAIQATMRDIEEFGVKRSEGFDLMGAVASVTANYIMETPGLASFDRFFKAIDQAAKGDPSTFSNFFGQAIAGAGEPYYQFRKFVAEGFDPRKPANLGAKYSSQQFWLDNPEAPDNPIFATLRAGKDSIGSTLAYNFEYSSFGFLADEVVNVLNGHPEGRSRRALWWGKPGETVNVRGGGKYNALRAVMGRYMPFPDDLDVVGREMVTNLIQPPRADLYSGKEYNIRGVNKTVLNDFNHFLNQEFRYYDSTTGILHVGIHSALKDLIESGYYKNLPGVDSPYASSGYSILPGIKAPLSPTPPNWETKNNEKRTILANYVQSLFNKAKEDFMMGEYENQQYRAPEALKEAVLKHRRSLLGGL